MTRRPRTLACVVINNAGTTGTDGYSNWELEDSTSEEMLYVFKINTVGPLLVVQQLLKNGIIGTDEEGGGRGALVGFGSSRSFPPPPHRGSFAV